MGDSQQHSRQAQPRDVFPDRRRPHIASEVHVLDFPAGVAGGEIEDLDDPREAARADVAREVLPIGFDDGVMDLAGLPQPTRPREGRHRFGHAADEQVGAKLFEEAVVERRIQSATDLERGDQLGQPLFAGAPQELGEGHGSHMEIRHPAHGHPQPMLGEGEVQQGACRQHGEIAAVFPQIAEGWQGLRHRLDLVEEQKRAPADRPDAGQGFKGPEEVGWIVPGEGGAEVGVPFEVDLRQGPFPPLGEEPHQRGLPDLPGASQDEGLPVGAVQPRPKGGEVTTEQ